MMILPNHSSLSASNEDSLPEIVFKIMASDIFLMGIYILANFRMTVSMGKGYSYIHMNKNGCSELFKGKSLKR
jgi:hypothetical protein